MKTAGPHTPFTGQTHHVPGQEYYERTRIDENAGERWFCSEDEAEEAGWRKAYV